MTAMREFDVVVIGAGPAGTAALRAGISAPRPPGYARRLRRDGRKRRADSGARAHAARLAREARQLARYGIGVNDRGSITHGCGACARGRRRGAGQLDAVRANPKAGVELFEHAGTARFRYDQAIESASAPPFTCRKRFIICTGGISRPLGVPGEELAVTPSAAFGLTGVPKSLIVIGAGATGAQVASIFNAFGASIPSARPGRGLLRPRTRRSPTRSPGHFARTALRFLVVSARSCGSIRSTGALRNPSRVRTVRASMRVRGLRRRLDGRHDAMDLGSRA